MRSSNLNSSMPNKRYFDRYRVKMIWLPVLTVHSNLEESRGKSVKARLRQHVRNGVAVI